MIGMFHEVTQATVGVGMKKCLIRKLRLCRVSGVSGSIVELDEISSVGVRPNHVVRMVNVNVWM
jgi:hypothetical protein